MGKEACLRTFLVLLLVLGRAAFAQAPPAGDALASYVARPEPAFGYYVRDGGRYRDAEWVELILTSQAWRGAPWSLLLVPGWQRLNGMQIPEAVAHQWAITTETMLDDLERIDPSRVLVMDYSTFLSAPQAEIERLAQGAGLSWDRSLGETLPHSKTTVSAPDPDKWRRIAQVIEAVWPIVEKADRRAREFLRSRGVIVAGSDELEPASSSSAPL